jgi:VWFA-related protein
MTFERLNSSKGIYMYTKKFLLMIVVSLAAAITSVAQEPTETIRVNTRLVSIPVVVSDRNGRYLPNLKAADFTVLQDGKPQQIEFFAATDEPLTIAVLIDTSHSTRAVLPDIKDSALALLKLLRPRDQAMVVTFDFETHVLSPLTSDRRRLENAIMSAEIPDIPGTTLRDATYQTIERSFAGIKGRKALIVLTDGKDARSRISSDDLLYALEESDTLVYTIMFKTGRFFNQPPPRARDRDFDIFGGGFPPFGGRRRPMRDNPRRAERDQRVSLKNEEAEDFLREISSTTAGRFFTSEDGRLTKTFTSIIEELRFQYRIGFYPPDESSSNTLHQLQVRVNRPDVSVRARRSYRVED